MFLYKHFICYLNFILMSLIRSVYCETNHDLSIVKTGLHNVSPRSVGLQFFTVINNTSSNDLEVELTPNQCCLIDDDNVNCEILDLIGGCMDTFPQGTTKSLNMIVPLLDPLERRGYCTAFVDSKSIEKGTKRNKIRIDFDTRIQNRQLIDVPTDVKQCNVDEDPLNDCKPVDCESYYNGKKTFFDKKLKRCVETPVCLSDKDDTTKIIYDAETNRCVRESVTKSDIDFIKRIAEEKTRVPKDVIIFRKLHNPKLNNFNYAGIANTTSKPFCKKCNNIRVLQASKMNNLQVSAKNSNKCLKHKLMEYFPTNRLTSILLTVILVQSCLIATMVYFLTKNCKCCKKKEVVSKFFNYRQDVSITTPLIGTSNIDTETTEFNYQSDTSNVKKKIKCYKACHKEKSHDVKMSMSDDILSKCLSRRDWNRKAVKSEVIPESSFQEEVGNTDAKEPSKIECYCSKKKEDKVTFESELLSKEKRDKRSHIEDKSSNEFDLNGGSEKEIKCYSYNYIDNLSNTGGMMANTQSKILGFCHQSKTKNATVSIASEKGAQAYFSNDSIDDFLSERGLLYLAGDDISKYSTSSGRAQKNSSVSSEVSSKTSKNNILKNVISLLNKKGKKTTVSDPGQKKKSEVDVQLIHMSQASIYSSTNNESDNLNALTTMKDSRTSL